MKTIKKMQALAATLMLAMVAVLPVAQAGVADKVQRAKVGPVDVLVYPMDVKDVVTVMGAMPLGDATVASRADNPAVASLTGLMLQRGTTTHSKYQIADTLAAVGAQAQISPDDTRIGLYGKSLAKDMPTVVGLLLEQLRSPAFDAAEFANAKAMLGAMLQQASDDPDNKAYETLGRQLFAQGSPNYPLPREAMQKAIDSASVAQLKAFHAKYYGPAHLTLVFTGDVSLADASAAVRKAIAGWNGGVDYARHAPAAPAPATHEVKVAMQDKASVSVMWGQATGLRRSDADYLPLQVGVNILGSGFTGRLMSTVRDKEGLTYGIGADLFADDVVEGGFMMNATFAPELLTKGVASSRRQLDRWWQQGVTANELAARKQALTGAWQLQMGTTVGMAQTLLMSVIRGQDLAWIDAFPQKLDTLTLEQVNTAIRTRLDPAKMVLVEAGSFGKP